MNTIAIDQARRQLAGLECRLAMMRAVNAELNHRGPSSAARISAELEGRGCQVEAALLEVLLDEGAAFEGFQLDGYAGEIARLCAVVADAGRAPGNGS